MEKLPMCRICLADNVRMYIVVNRNLHELYEKLTDNPFVTKDNRPILACFFCCAKLKQCYRLLRQCLEAEELFTLMMNEDYELNPLINQAHLEYCNGLIKSPIEHISIHDECQTESIIKEELPAVCEGVDDVIEPKKEHQSDELEPKNLYNSCLDVADTKQHHSESDLEDDVPLMELRTKVEEEQEVFKKKQRARGTKELEPENLDNSCLDVADIPPHHSESDSEDDVPLMVFQSEVQEVSKKKRRARETTRANIAKKAKLDTQRTKEKDAITAEQVRKDKSDSKVIRTTQKRTSKPGNYFKDPYKCDQRSFSEKSNSTNHIRIHTGKQPYKCDVCQRSFNQKSNLTQHIRTHTGEKPYKCDVCQQNFRNKSNLTRHVRTHSGSGEKPYRCDVCQRGFSEKDYLTQHVRIHSGEKPYRCDVCQRSFSFKSSLTKHVRIHTGEKPYKCYVCQRSFSQKIQLSRHTRTHTGEKPYKCDVCQRSFSQKIQLSRHTRTHTDEKPYKCDVCQRSFSRKIHLSQHTRTHTGEKPYRCDVCQRSFGKKSNFSQHIRIHTGEKPYKCDVCQSSFSRKSSLSQHIRIHAGEKPYSCDVCQRSFSKKENLIRHARIHTGEKPYRCDVCQRSFSKKENLTRHARIHTGEKPYRCDVCQRNFSEKNTLTSHVRIHTGVKVKSFISNRHIKGTFERQKKN